MVAICNGRIDWSDATKRGWKFLNILNNIRTGKSSEDKEKQLQKIKIPIENVHTDATLLFARYSPKDYYNASKNKSVKSSWNKNRIYWCFSR